MTDCERKEGSLIKTRADIYGKEAAELLRIISMYPGILQQQLCGFYPGREEMVQTLLSHLKKQGRIITQETSGGYYLQGVPVAGTDHEMQNAVWVLLDFIDRVEFHSASDFPVKIIFFAAGELYEIIAVTAGRETLITQAVTGNSLRDNGRRILIVEEPWQIPLLNIPCTSGYCTVEPDGKVCYYKKQQEEHDWTEK